MRSPGTHGPARHGWLDGAAQAFFRLLVLLLVGLILAPLCLAFAQGIPTEAKRYQLTLRREAQRVWGLDAPIATFAAQVHQESRWRTNARSVAGAVGLAQFMPATADWIGGVYGDLRERAPLNPTWALRGLVTYDRFLFDRVEADTPCERMAFALSAYNGGLGWVHKRQRLSLQPGVCMHATCDINPGIAPSSQRENERYPRTILLRFEPLYEAWGPESCP